MLQLLLYRFRAYTFKVMEYFLHFWSFLVQTSYRYNSTNEVLEIMLLNLIFFPIYRVKFALYFPLYFSRFYHRQIGLVCLSCEFQYSI